MPDSQEDTIFTIPPAPPGHIRHKKLDVPCLQSVHFAEKLTNVLGPEKVQLNLLDGARHGNPRFGEPENLEKVFAFLEKVLK